MTKWLLDLLLHLNRSMDLVLVKIKTNSSKVSCGGGLGQEKGCISSIRGSRAALWALGALGFLSLTLKGISSHIEYAGAFEKRWKVVSRSKGR